MPVTRPRVRNEDGEVKLSTLEKLRSQDLLDDRIREKMLLGVSSRKYGKVIDAYAESLGVSKSAASRAFKRASQKELDSINEAEYIVHPPRKLNTAVMFARAGRFS